MTPESREQKIRQALVIERQVWGIPSVGDPNTDGAFTDDAIERAVRIIESKIVIENDPRHALEQRRYKERRTA